MPRFEWKDEYNSGVRSIDEDHQRFFAIANEFAAEAESGVDAEKIEAVVQELILQAEEHFDREERYMRRGGYPGYAKHRRIHEDLRDAVVGLREIFHENPSCVDPEKLVTFLGKWLIHHIVTVDFEMVKFLRSENMGDKEVPFRRVDVTLKVDEDKADLLREFGQFIDSQGPAAEHLEVEIRQLIEARKQRGVDKAKELFCKT